MSDDRAALWSDAAVYLVAVAFALANAAWATLTPHRIWGRIAWCPPLLALTVAVALIVIRRSPPDRVRLTLAALVAAGSAVVPAAVLMAQRAEGRPARAQSEVWVIEGAGARMVERGTPYLARDGLTAALNTPGVGPRAYVPYGPPLAAFGVPSRWLAPPASDARLWFLLGGGALAATAAAMAPVGARGRVRLVQCVAVIPPTALAIAVSGTDLPVIALCLLALALSDRRRWVWVGLAVGLATSMKSLAAPVAVLVAIAAAHTDSGPTDAVRSDGGPAPRAPLNRRWSSLLRLAAGGAVGVLVPLLPALAADPAAVARNLFGYPLGLTGQASLAASPLPGRLLADTGTAGRLGAVAALLVGVAWVLARRWRRPARHSGDLAFSAALALAVFMTAAPSSRFGYAVYPIAFLGWWWAWRDKEHHSDARGPIGSPGRRDQPVSSRPSGTTTAG